MNNGTGKETPTDNDFLEDGFEDSPLSSLDHDDDDNDDDDDDKHKDEYSTEKRKCAELDEEDQIVDIEDPVVNKTHTNIDDDDDDDNDDEEKRELNVPIIPIPTTIPTINPATRLVKEAVQHHDKHNNDPCTICLETFRSEDDIFCCSNGRHPHCFHQECAVDYLVSHTEGVQAPCPLCRKPFLLCCSYNDYIKEEEKEEEERKKEKEIVEEQEEEEEEGNPTHHFSSLSLSDLLVEARVEGGIFSTTDPLSLSLLDLQEAAELGISPDDTILFYLIFIHRGNNNLSSSCCCC